MKALIISDDEKLVKSTSSFLENKNYDIIVYKWLLKALDNIEEIRPDLIIVSSSEYPRHWKTLVQFVKSGIGGDCVQIYLYEPTPLSIEDDDKAKVLGINGYFTSVDELENMFNPVEEEVPSVDSLVAEAEEPVAQVAAPVEKAPEFGHIMITHPVDMHFMTGKVTAAADNTLTCALDFDTDLASGTELSKCSYIWNDEIKNITGTVSSVSSDKKEIVIQVTNYEKI